jgi:hypothetical protein
MTSRTPIATRRHTAAAVLLTAVVLMGTACTAGQPPPPAGQPSSQSPSAPSAVSPSATPTPSASYKPADAAGKAQNVPVPVLPEAARAETKEGLEAFAKYWFELLSYGYETGDVSRLVALTSPACEACENAKRVITGWHSEGRWLVGGRITTPSVSTTFKLARDGNYQVAMQVAQEGISYYKPDGTLSSADPKPEDTGNLLLAVFKSGSWFVNNIQPIVG